MTFDSRGASLSWWTVDIVRVHIGTTKIMWAILAQGCGFFLRVILLHFRQPSCGTEHDANLRVDAAFGQTNFWSSLIGRLWPIPTLAILI